MVRDSKLINKPYAGLDSYFVVITESVDVACYENFDFQKNTTLNHTNPLPSLNTSVETPKIENTKYSSSVKDSS